MLDYALFSRAEYCIRIPLVCYLCNTILAAVFAVFSLIHYTLSQLSILLPDVARSLRIPVSPV